METVTRSFSFTDPYMNYVIPAIERGRCLKSTQTSKSRYWGTRTKVVYRAYRHHKGNEHEVIDRQWLELGFWHGIFEVTGDNHVRFTDKGLELLKEHRELCKARREREQAEEEAQREKRREREAEAMRLELMALALEWASTTRLPSRSRSESADLSAPRFILRGSSDVQSRGRGPCTLPPPFQSGERRLEIRARPVPFCFQSFLPLPETFPRVLVLTVP